jgi:hypothetical protein
MIGGEKGESFTVELGKQWENRFKGRHFPPALILTGEKRRSLADYLAQCYVCEGEAVPCGDCIHCRKVKAGIHPDVIELRPEGETLKVEAVRQMRSDAYIRPNEAERKVYLITRAETMNDSGQNALLKILEEGPAYAAFFFLLPNPEGLLDTLRSRCEILRWDGEEQEAVYGEEAVTFCQRLLSKDSLKLMESCVALEKKKREELSPFLDHCIVYLAKYLPQDPKGLLPKLTALRLARAYCEQNVGVGHIVGLLLAELI